MKLVCLGAMALIATAAPAAADVKAGVDAWARGDYDRAVAEWRAPAIAGDADAQFNMGQASKLGRGVPLDQEQATEWFRRAAAQGHPQAGDNYALILFREGRKADALPWLEKSAARDEKRTELVLGAMLFNGDGVPKDWVRAYALVSRASQQGLPQAAPTLAQMDSLIPEAQRRQGLAMASQIADARARHSATATATAPVLVAPTSVKEPAPVRREAKAPVPVPAAVTGGKWRIQLGAFRDEGNARALWARVGDRTGGRVSYARSGQVTKLLATGFASRATAQTACGKAGVPCMVIAP